ncbi:SDR family NAD(P)-dependent oxidoreductase [Falsiroseomonas selenitidurans]|uniref:SDR family oxidoreductase n=1 Tax=Falsiroseomonas selenitidurans TaxID=2716335 RepID=A0ABX1EBX0_9PROT|nr:SDR family NAD(P)-dependent oxidoreductase [Falsiroseomonas selenitidurans]NKC34326.1 SDR family oxidoreductase [Falsiroseomonas selenitidurans]
MDIDLSRRTAIVTGSTAGIGFAAAVELARLGARVVVNGRDAQATAAALDRLRRLVPGAEGLAVAADLGTAAGAAALVEAVPKADILVNNVGIYEPKPALEIPDEDWMRLFEVNVMSGVRLSRAYMPGMMARRWGRVVFVSSESALQIPVEMVHYGLTKTAQLALSRGLAETAAGTGVTVNAVLPGPTRTEGVRGFLAKMAADQGVTEAEVEAAFIRENRPSSLIGRFATPEEVAAMIAYVCSPAASATSGAALRVDGGVVRAAA